MLETAKTPIAIAPMTPILQTNFVICIVPPYLDFAGCEDRPQGCPQSIIGMTLRFAPPAYNRISA
jgi:hypothetical protein